MKRSLLSVSICIALTSAASFAGATGQHTPPPPVQPPLVSVPILSPNANANAQANSQSRADAKAAARAEQRQQQQQAQQQAQQQQQRNEQGQQATLQGRTGDVSVQGDQAGSGDRVIVHPSMVPPSPVAMNPQGNLAAIAMGCGPQINLVREPVYATSKPAIGSPEAIKNGDTFTAWPVMGTAGEPIPYLIVNLPDGSKQLIGSNLIVGMSITNQSIAGNIALGFVQSSGSGGQIGGGGSSALQQMGDRMVAVPCVAGTIPAPSVQTEKVVYITRYITRSPIMMPIAKRKPAPAKKCDDTVIVSKSACIVRK